MKILLSAYGCDPKNGSEQRVGWNVAQALAERGHEVWVLTEPRGVGPAAEAIRQGETHPNLHLHFIGHTAIGRRLPASSWMLRYLAWQQAAYHAALVLSEGIDFDVVHHLTWSSLQGGSRLWRLDKPFVFGPVGGAQVAPGGFRRYFGARWWREEIRTMVARHALRLLPTVRGAAKQADVVLAANIETYEATRALGARVELCHEVALPDDYLSDEYPVRQSGETLEVVWIGRLMARKALRLAVEAISEVPDNVPVHLTIVGGEQLDPETTALIAERNLGSRVTHRGQVPWTEVRDILFSRDVMLFTSLRDTNGMQLLEAMGAGLPIVGLDHQGVGTLVTDSCGLRVPVSTPERVAKGLAQALVRLQEDPDLRQELGRGSWKEAHRHTWSARLDEFEQHYASVVSATSAVQ